jgi:hypothetical protein
MSNRPPRVGLGAVFGLLLILGVVIQVVKLLVVRLTILAIGAVVTVPIYLVTKNRRNDAKVPLPRRRAHRLSLRTTASFRTTRCCGCSLATLHRRSPSSSPPKGCKLSPRPDLRPTTRVGQHPPRHRVDQQGPRYRDIDTAHAR